MELGERLGADVPFFIFGRTGFVEGIGEIITPLEIPPASYAVIWPGRGISTAEIFAAPNLTRDTKSLKIDILSGKALEIWPNLYGHNDLQNVAQELEHRVTEGLGMLACGTHDARMTGSAALSSASSPIRAATGCRVCPTAGKDLPQSRSGSIRSRLGLTRNNR